MVSPGVPMKDRTFLNETINQAYNIAIEDIRFFKRQQWHITYYTLLIYTAIIYAGRLSVDNLLIFVVLIGVLILSLCSSLYLIHVLEVSLENARRRKNCAHARMRDIFPDDETIRSMFSLDDDEMDGKSTGRINENVINILKLVAILGFMASLLTLIHVQSITFTVNP